MTIGTIVWIVFVAIVGLVSIVGLVVYAINEAMDTRDRVLAVLVAVFVFILSISICVFSGWWNMHSASGRRAYKSQQSNLNGGINRVVKVYDMEGDEIARYEGKFDVEHRNQDNRIMFDDENGKRHIIYYTTGTVIVDEDQRLEINHDN